MRCVSISSDPSLLSPPGRPVPLPSGHPQFVPLLKGSQFFPSPAVSRVLRHLPLPHHTSWAPPSEARGGLAHTPLLALPFAPGNASSSPQTLLPWTSGYLFVGRLHFPGLLSEAGTQALSFKFLSCLLPSRSAVVFKSTGRLHFPSPSC